MKKIKVPNTPAVFYQLQDYADIFKPLCDRLMVNKSKEFILGPDNEKDKKNIWEFEDSKIKLAESTFDSVVFDFLDEVHPLFLGKGKNYLLHKDSWIAGPTTWQHVRIHRHIQPFIRDEEIGDVVTVFYVHLDENINENNGFIEFFESTDRNNITEEPNNLNPIFKYVPKKYDLLIMTAEVWHRANPFTGERYSLATDIKVKDENI